MSKKRKPQIGVFQRAVIATPDITNCYQPGLRALGGNSSKIQLSGAAEGSVDIDACTANKYPNANRWDYTFGFKSQAYFVEVHSANTGEASTVIAKLNWLKQWLHQHAKPLNAIKADKPFYWIQSNGFHILPQSRQYRLVVKEGIKPIAKLVLN